MKTIKKMTSETMASYVQAFEVAEKQMLPMLPYVKMPFHDFNRYKTYHDKGIFLMDTVGEEACLYHLYHLTEGDDTLRITLCLPTSWEKRFEILETSVPNLKQWFMANDSSRRFVVQTLEYGEIEYYPTLGEYLMPIFIKNGFEPKYRMYMKKEKPTVEVTAPEGVVVKAFEASELNSLKSFYYDEKALENLKYFTNCTLEEFLESMQKPFAIEHSKVAYDQDGQIIGATVVAKEDDKIWIDNFSVLPEYEQTHIGTYLLNQTVKSIEAKESQGDLIIYLNRDCFEAIEACEKNGFVSFEFWTDLFLDK